MEGNVVLVGPVAEWERFIRGAIAELRRWFDQIGPYLIEVARQLAESVRLVSQALGRTGLCADDLWRQVHRMERELALARYRAMSPRRRKDWKRRERKALARLLA